MISDGMNALMKKGLRLGLYGRFANPLDGMNALMKKGLRLLLLFLLSEVLRWNECPDEEGIKTPASPGLSGREHDGMNALMKKGLRRRIWQME